MQRSFIGLQPPILLQFEECFDKLSMSGGTVFNRLISDSDLWSLTSDHRRPTTDRRPLAADLNFSLLFAIRHKRFAIYLTLILDL